MGSGVSTRKNAKKKKVFTTFIPLRMEDVLPMIWEFDGIWMICLDVLVILSRVRGWKETKDPRPRARLWLKEVKSWHNDFYKKLNHSLSKTLTCPKKVLAQKKTCPLSPRNKKQKPQPPLFQHITGVLSHPTCGCSSSCKWTEKPIGTIVLGVPYPNDYGGYFTIGYNV